MNASGASELSRLVVIDRLEVGPVKVEGDRIAATYRVGEDSFELAYKYEEPVFDPERSPLNGIPVSLGEPIFRILLQHAEGALQRSGRVWHAFDLLGAVAAIQGLSLDEIHQSTPSSPSEQTD